MCEGTRACASACCGRHAGDALAWRRLRGANGGAGARPSPRARGVPLEGQEQGHAQLEAQRDQPQQAARHGAHHGARAGARGARRRPRGAGTTACPRAGRRKPGVGIRWYAGRGERALQAGAATWHASAAGPSQARMCERAICAPMTRQQMTGAIMGGNALVRHLCACLALAAKKCSWSDAAPFALFRRHPRQMRWHATRATGGASAR